MMSTLSSSKSLYSIFASLLLLSCSSPALASETTSYWEGPYVAAYLGGAVGSNHASTDVGTASNNASFSSSADVNAINNSGTFTQNPTAVIAGIQAGQDWAYKKIVYGMVFDYSSMPLNSTYNVNNMAYPTSSDEYSIHTSMSTNWLFTLRGRFGYQAQWYSHPSLLYATGGMAMTQLKVTNSFSDNSAYGRAGGSTTSSNQIGYTLGTGVELALLQHMSAMLEYSYIRVPPVRTTSSITNTQEGIGIPAQSQTSPFSTNGAFHANLFKVGLKYRF